MEPGRDGKTGQFQLTTLKQPEWAAAAVVGDASRTRAGGPSKATGGKGKTYFEA